MPPPSSMSTRRRSSVSSLNCARPEVRFEIPGVRFEIPEARREDLLRRASEENVITLMKGCSPQYDTLSLQRTRSDAGTRDNSPNFLVPMRGDFADSSAPSPNMPLTEPSNFVRRRRMSFDDADYHANRKMGHVDPICGVKTMLPIEEERALGGPFSDGSHEVSRECVEATLRAIALSRALDADGTSGSPLSRRRASIHEPPALVARERSSHRQRRRHSSEMVLDEISGKHIPVSHHRHSRHLPEGRASDGVERAHSDEVSARVGSSKNVKDRQELSGVASFAVPLNQVSTPRPTPPSPNPYSLPPGLKSLNSQPSILSPNP